MQEAIKPIGYDGKKWQLAVAEVRSMTEEEIEEDRKQVKAVKAQNSDRNQLQLVVYHGVLN